MAAPLGGCAAMHCRTCCVASLPAGAARDHVRSCDRPASASMHLIELFLPISDNTGQAFPTALFDAVRARLTGQFGGVTAFLRTPAVGAWEDDGGAVRRDEVVLFEVMVPHVDHGWWAAYRTELEARFRQDEILIRASAVERL
jgi:hypothetical protein